MMIAKQDICQCDACEGVAVAAEGECPPGWAEVVISVYPGGGGPALRGWRGHACSRSCLVRLVEGFAARAMPEASSRPRPVLPAPGGEP